jgi:hypothetical protein
MIEMRATVRKRVADFVTVGPKDLLSTPRELVVYCFRPERT